MKNLSTVLNVVLLIAVAVLFFLYFSLKSSLGGGTENSGSDKEQKKLIIDKIDPANLPKGKIAFIDVDSITFGYEYIKDESKTLGARQQAIQSQYESMTMKFQQEYQAYQEMAQAGIASRPEIEKKAAELEQKQKDILGKENQMKALELEVAKKQEEMMKSVNAFIAKFNEQFHYDFILSKISMVNTLSYANPQLDVTSAVLKGLNEEYRLKKEASKKP
ncbi:MAG: OmpH family outer membrane protein [Bacteroidia bacterium]|nr:OmpH family outer membrane protein [Bacteroidia bacterium]